MYIASSGGRMHLQKYMQMICILIENVVIKKITKSFAELYKALQKFLMVQRDEADEKMSLKAFKTMACFAVQG